MSEKMTWREWLDVFSDLDAYMARGGQLLDLPMHSLDELPEVVLEKLGEEKLSRIGRFATSIAEYVFADEEVGNVLAEEHLRDLWRKSAA